MPCLALRVELPSSPWLPGPLPSSQASSALPTASWPCPARQASCDHHLGPPRPGATCQAHAVPPCCPPRLCPCQAPTAAPAATTNCRGLIPSPPTVLLKGQCQGRCLPPQPCCAPSFLSPSPPASPLPPQAGPLHSKSPCWAHWACPCVQGWAPARGQRQKVEAGGLGRKQGPQRHGGVEEVELTGLQWQTLRGGLLNPRGASLLPPPQAACLTAEPQPLPLCPALPYGNPLLAAP